MPRWKREYVRCNFASSVGTSDRRNGRDGAVGSRTEAAGRLGANCEWRHPVGFYASRVFPLNIHLLAVTSDARVVPSVCLVPVTPIASPAFSSPHAFPENVVALFVRT